MYERASFKHIMSDYIYYADKFSHLLDEVLSARLILRRRGILRILAPNEAISATAWSCTCAVLIQRVLSSETTCMLCCEFKQSQVCAIEYDCMEYGMSAEEAFFLP